MHIIAPPKPGLTVRIMNRFMRALPLKSKLTHYSLLLRNDLTRSVQPDVDSSSRFSLANAEDLAYITRHPEALAGAVYSNRLANGDLCFCLKVKGEIVSYNWVRFTNCCVYCGRRSGFEFDKLEEDQAFTYDFYTYEQHRRRGFGTRLKISLLNELAARGVREVRVIVQPGNLASLKVHLKLNYELAGIRFGYGILRWTRTFSGSTRDNRKMAQWIRAYSEQLAVGQ